MSFRSKLLHRIIAFFLGVLLTPIAAIGGALVILMPMTSCVFSPASCLSDFLVFLLAGTYFGTIYAAPCTALFVPLLYVVGGSRMPPFFFALISSVLGFVTGLGWIFMMQLANSTRWGTAGINPFLAAAMVGAFVFGLVYLPIVKFVERRFASRFVAAEPGATT
jgi:hypothetical protein